MNLVTRKHAQELLAAFHQEGLLPSGPTAPLPEEQALDNLETYEQMFEVYRNADNSPLDEFPGPGKLVMRSHLPHADPRMQWVLDYRGNISEGELSETYEVRGGEREFDDHTLVRYRAETVDVLNLHVEEHEVLAHALRLDRQRPGRSRVQLYRWTDETQPVAPSGTVNRKPILMFDGREWNSAA